MRPTFDELTMRPMSLKSLDLILSLSKDEAWISAFFSILLVSYRALRNQREMPISEIRGITDFLTMSARRKQNKKASPVMELVSSTYSSGLRAAADPIHSAVGTDS